MTPSPKALRLGTAAALVAASGAQAQQSCPLENRVYNLSPTGERVNLSEVGELREGVFLHLDPVMRELQSCASREEIQSSTAVIEYQDGTDVRARDGVFGLSVRSTRGNEFQKWCCASLRQCNIAVQVYRGDFTCQR